MNPKWHRIIFKLLRSFCPSHLVEEIEGDLIQRFERDLKSSDHSEWSDDYRLRRAKRRLFWNTLKFFRPGIFSRNKFSLPLTSFFMLLNFFRVAVRVMNRNKTFSCINISGLTLGMTGALLLFAWIMHELSYEEVHSNVGYQITRELN